MPKNRIKQRANARKFREENLDKKNAFGFTDLTPYKAVNGKDAMSRPTLSDAIQEVPGGFNTTKK